MLLFCRQWLIEIIKVEWKEMNCLKEKKKKKKEYFERSHLHAIHRLRSSSQIRISLAISAHSPYLVAYV